MGQTDCAQAVGVVDVACHSSLACPVQLRVMVFSGSTVFSPSTDLSTHGGLLTALSERRWPAGAPALLCAWVGAPRPWQGPVPSCSASSGSRPGLLSSRGTGRPPLSAGLDVSWPHPRTRVSSSPLQVGLGAVGGRNLLDAYLGSTGSGPAACVPALSRPQSGPGTERAMLCPPGCAAPPRLPV